MLISAAAIGIGALPAVADEGAKVTPLMSKDLQDYPGKRG